MLQEAQLEETTVHITYLAGRVEALQGNLDRFLICCVFFVFFGSPIVYGCVA